MVNNIEPCWKIIASFFLFCFCFWEYSFIGVELMKIRLLKKWREWIVRKY
jgi:hypothetical protein